MTDAVKFAIAAALVVVLAAWGIHGGGFFGGTARQAQEKLQINVDQRVAGIGAGDWARVTMHGQRAEIAGYAPSEEDLLVARGAVRSAVWDGGWLLGGVTAVASNEARVWAERQGAYPWRAELDRARLHLTGAAPNRETARELEALAGALFVDRRVINDLDIDPVPPDEGWAEAARGALAALSHVEIGAAELADFTLTLTGTAATPEDAEAARTSLERLVGVVSATSSADVRAPRPAPSAPVPAEPRSAPADQPEQTAGNEEASAAPPVSAEQGAASIPPAAAAAAPAAATEAGLDCQAQLDAALAESDIHFDVNSAALADASLPLLEQIAAVAAACPPLVLRIEGHTDDTGVATLNQSLSERRATAVADRLADLGVDRARLRAVGRGAGDPAAANVTETGRRQNRRIEIIVER